MNKLAHHVASIFSPQKWVGVRMLVAVSGGPDSVALARLLVSLGQSSDQWNPKNLIIAHINHQTRGTESENDASFVKQLALELGIEFRQSNSMFRDNLKDSEEALRQFRYDQLVLIAQSVGARYLAMGHNQDDQVETILFRILRGTGIHGLCGVPTTRLVTDSLTLVRPLIQTRRAEIEAYLDEIGQAFRIDDSNSDPKYTRNFLRHHLIPAINTRFSVSAEALLRLADQACELDEFLSTESDKLGPSIISRSQDEVSINCQELQDTASVLLRHWLIQIWTQQDWPRQSMNHQWWKTIADLIQSESNQILNLPCSIRMEKQGTLASFERSATPELHRKNSK